MASRGVGEDRILLAFRVGRTREFPASPASYYDKDTLPLRDTRGVEENIRIVPGGSSVRSGAFLGENVIIMPPAFVNVGAYVGRDTMIDSHALVGSCAQVGERVHLSAGAQLGGVLEPVGLRPVIVEDDAMIGGNVGVSRGPWWERERCWRPAFSSLLPPPYTTWFGRRRTGAPPTAP